MEIECNYLTDDTNKTEIDSLLCTVHCVMLSRTIVVEVDDEKLTLALMNFAFLFN